MLANLHNFSSTLGKMTDVSKDQLRKEITAILKNADLTKTSGKQVRQQLEEKLDVDLADQKKVVDKLVLEIVEELQKTTKKGKKGKKESEDEEEDDEENGDNEEDEEEEEDSDEGAKKKKKPAPKRAPPKRAASDSEEGSDDNEKDDDYMPKKKGPAAKKGGKRKKKGSESESDEDWAKSKKKRGGGAAGGGGGGGGGAGKGYTKPYKLSPELAKLMGQDSMPRHEVVKRIWAIIKERNLYDPKNKQFAVCDDDLLKVFNVKRFRTFGMMKYLKDHFKG